MGSLWSKSALVGTFVVVCPCLADAAAAQQSARLSLGDQQVHRVELRASTFTTSAQGEATVVSDPATGGWIAAWQSRRQNGGRAGVFGQRFDAAARPVGGEFRLSPADDVHQLAPALAVAQDGRAYAAWQAFGQDGDDWGVMARAFDGAERPVSVDVRGAQTAPRLVTSGDAVYSAWVGADAAGTPRAWLRRVDADGLWDEAVPVEAEAGLRHGRVDLAALPDGGVAAAWAAQDAAGDPAGVWLRCFAADGGPTSEAVRVDGGTGVALEPCVALAGESLAVVWMQLAGEVHDVVARRLTVAGAPAGDPFLVVAAAGAVQTGATVAGAADGRLCFAWNRGEADADVWAVVYDADGEALGAPFVVHAHTDGAQRLAAGGARSAVAYGADGALAFAWDGDGGQGDDSGAHVTWLLAARPELAEADAAPVDEVAAAPAAPTPHDPPYRNHSDAGKLPFGGDPNPFARMEFGFIGITNAGWTPPDPHMAVGPDHVVQMTNGAIAWFLKDGTKQFETQIEGGSGFWGGLGATGFVFDPEVVYDPHAGRFVAMAAERSSSNRSIFLLALSDDADPNGTWHKYRLDVTTLANDNDIDSPNLAVDAQAVYLSADFFGPDKYLVYILDKTPLLAGAPVGVTKSVLINGSQSYGLPVTYPGAPAQYMLQHFESSTSNTLRLHAITNPLTSPARVTFDLAVPTYARPASVVQGGTTSRITTFEARFWSCVWRNGSLWATHHEGNPTRAQWYEIQTNGWPLSGRNPVVAQQGEIDPGPDRIYTSFSSIGVDAFGNAMLAFARSSSSEKLSVARTFRLADDPPGTMRPMLVAKQGTGISTSRWGDYSAVVPDPSDPCTLWYTHEYAPSNGSWNTWVGKAQVCSLGADAGSVSVGTGGVVNFTLVNPSLVSRPYFLVGTVSGTTPGVPLPGGGVVLPINLDAFSNLVLGSANGPEFVNFFGTLDAAGRGSATLNLPAIAAGAGLTMHYAYAQDGSAWTFASNPVAVQLVP